MLEPPPGALAEAAAGAERAFVLALGGFALEVSGASLVTLERIPLARFNYAVVGRVGAERQTTFFERALDHYFQRALRPTFRLPTRVPPHLDDGLRRFGFRRRADPYVLWWRLVGSERVSVPIESGAVRVAAPAELDTVASLWAEGVVRDELRRALEVLERRPNPGERCRSLAAQDDGRPVGTAVLYEHDGIAGLHGVATVPDRRGEGIATALVQEALALLSSEPATVVVLASDSPAATRPLESLGFARFQEYAEYELPADAQLSLPDPGPPQPPRWRPPRRPPGEPTPGSLPSSSAALFSRSVSLYTLELSGSLLLDRRM
jgi:RimJ/RimL family protein N-acetyltransferase